MISFWLFTDRVGYPCRPVDELRRPGLVGALPRRPVGQFGDDAVGRLDAVAVGPRPRRRRRRRRQGRRLPVVGLGAQLDALRLRQQRDDGRAGAAHAGLLAQDHARHRGSHLSLNSTHHFNRTLLLSVIINTEQART